MEQMVRPFTPKEIRFLKTIKTKYEKDLSKKIKFQYYFIALIAGIVFAYLTSVTKNHFGGFIFGTATVFSFAFIVFMPYEQFKASKKTKQEINLINSFLSINKLIVTPIHATKIAIAKEYEDEGDLFIIEYKQDSILYLWDFDYNLTKSFPCLIFEIYEEAFCKLIGRQVNLLSERINPMEITAKSKWAYLGKYGSPGHLTTEEISFDKLIDKFNNIQKH